jgi:hypothetical protein
VQIIASQEAPVESYVARCKGAGEALSSWSLQLTDEQGKTKSFGPYTQDEVKFLEK